MAEMAGTQSLKVLPEVTRLDGVLNYGVHFSWDCAEAARVTRYCLTWVSLVTVEFYSN
jgi:hypothetical protein